MSNDKKTQETNFSDDSFLRQIVAATHGVQPHELTEEFLKQSIADEERRYRLECEARGETIATFGELKTTSLKAAQMREEIRERLRQAHTL